MAPKAKAKQAHDVVSRDLELPQKPARPPGAKAPGIQVELVTNLFRISLKIQKPIYCHTITIDAIDQQSSGDACDRAKKAAVPRKIPKDMRVQAVRNAIAQHVKDNKISVSGVAHSYVLDGNGSTMYSLFKVLDIHDGSSGARKHIEIRSTADSTRIVDKKAVIEKEPMLVRFFSPSPVDVKGLIDHCAGKSPRASADVDATLKLLNTILTGKITMVPGYLSMQAKTGSCSIFPYDRTKFPRERFPISEGIVCNRGFITSARPSEQGLMVSVANTVVPFYEPIKLVDLLRNRFRVQDLSRELQPNVIDELKRELRTKQVEAIHINYGTQASPHYRKYRIHDIGQSTTKEKFELQDTKGKGMISVFDYFKKEYPQCKLMYPNLPCIIDNKRKIPLEICRIVDKQKVNRKLNPLETSNVIKQAAMKPENHFDKVKQNAKMLSDYDQPMKDFGLELDKRPIELTGRELPPIKLWAAKQQVLMTREGAYDNNRAAFVKPASVLKWALVVLIDDRFQRNFRDQKQFMDECYRFGQEYCKSGQSKGVTISNLEQSGVHTLMVKMNDQDRDVKKRLRDEFVRLNSENYGHAVFILPGIKDWIYSYLQYLEVDVPKAIKRSLKCTRTSCIKDENFIKKILRGDGRSIFMFLSNLWLKYNTKLGGINHVLDGTQNFHIDKAQFNNFLLPGHLFVSIDVCHPAPGDRLEQSVAAAVGLWNITNPGMSSCTRVRVQRKDKSDKEKSTVEQVGEIGIMFEEIMMSYFQRTQNLPNNIVILRDGVSEGQFRMVLLYELAQIKARIKNLYDKSKKPAPKLSCLTVQKRHRTRFMRKVPVQTRRGDDFNIQPGTVVDHTVVEPLSHSFYLAPHKAIQGTSRAPHVHMIYDEIKFSQDSAQAMIFALSYLSPRCTKGTSIPTPVNLADLAAERGKNIVVSWNEDHPNLGPEERLIQLNAFLSDMGDPDYKNTLYYV